jgi:hypothetical protein
MYVCMFLDDGGLLLGSGGVFFGVNSFGSVTRHWSNSEIMCSFVRSVPRQRPTGNNVVVLSLPREHHSANTTGIAKGLIC